MTEAFASQGDLSEKKTSFTLSVPCSHPPVP